MSILKKAAGDVWSPRKALENAFSPDISALSISGIGAVTAVLSA